MNEHIETLKALMRNSEVQFVDEKVYPLGARCYNIAHKLVLNDEQFSTLTSVIDLLDPAKAEGHAKVLLDFSWGAHDVEIELAREAGAAALTRVAELEAANQKSIAYYEDLMDDYDSEKESCKLYITKLEAENARLRAALQGEKNADV